MKKLTQIVYIIKLLLLITHFYFIFVMLHNVLDTRIYGVIFLIFYLFFIVKLLLELLFQKKSFKDDLIYNIMHIGFLLYIHIISIKTFMAKVYVTKYTISYFRINYIILSILLFFILIYSLLDNGNVKQH